MYNIYAYTQIIYLYPVQFHWRSLIQIGTYLFVSSPSFFQQSRQVYKSSLSLQLSKKKGDLVIEQVIQEIHKK